MKETPPIDPSPQEPALVRSYPSQGSQPPEPPIPPIHRAAAWGVSLFLAAVCAGLTYWFLPLGIAFTAAAILTAARGVSTIRRRERAIVALLPMSERWSVFIVSGFLMGACTLAASAAGALAFLCIWIEGSNREQDWLWIGVAAGTAISGVCLAVAARFLWRLGD